MVINLGMNWENFYRDNILTYIKSLQGNPFELITLIIDLAIVIFLVYCFFRIVRGSRAWQLIKGIALLVIATWISRIIQFENIKLDINWNYEFRSYCNYSYFSTGTKKSFRTIRNKQVNTVFWYR